MFGFLRGAHHRVDHSIELRLRRQCYIGDRLGYRGQVPCLFEPGEDDLTQWRGVFHTASAPSPPARLNHQATALGLSGRSYVGGPGAVPAMMGLVRYADDFIVLVHGTKPEAGG
ncbi:MULTISPECIES: hypothetical protein [Streptomyces]|uniref:hypothetical protein n=1 Tax=Streptomyces TaxID=1883 RepID=UPI001E2FDEFE|nr:MULTISPECIES: hypothetical protein [Streptomyces]MCC0574177.1 hypothetical protein [Streptomyces californicus]